MYNWYAVIDPRGLAPAGYHVSTLADWETLKAGYNYDEVAILDAIMYPIGNFSNSNNSSGFGGLASGLRIRNSGDSYFSDFGSFGIFWTPIGIDNDISNSIIIQSNAVSIGSPNMNKNGLSVRCIKD